jgi:transposase InsO family protein
MSERTSDGRALRLLTILDEYTRECLAIDVQRRLDSRKVLDRLAALFVDRGIPEHIRSDNGPEFTAKAVREWLGRLCRTVRSQRLQTRRARSLSANSDSVRISLQIGQ